MNFMLANGRHLHCEPIVSPASQGILQFVPANAKENTSLAAEAKNAASRKVSELLQEAKREWDAAKAQPVAQAFGCALGPEPPSVEYVAELSREWN
jgi:hypothetical protein